MTSTRYCHGTFTLERLWASSPEHVFDAWADPDLKAQWFTGPPDRWTLVMRSMDFRPGGLEVLEGRFADNESTTRYEARFHHIEPGRRLVYAYDLHLAGCFHSVTLSSLALTPEPGGTRVTYTEQIVFLDGRDGTADRRHGTEHQFSMIERVLQLEGRDS